ncbi:MAG TPA: CopG family antitoxin [Xanthomonadales bacterium]|nr:CopG family antitoxin [Xanthomonadales bacterium]
MKKKKNKLPDFDKMTYAEEAKWWDTHSFTDYWDEFEDVEIVFELDKPREKTLVVRLQKEFKDQLEKIARSKGLNVSTLARMLLMEGINKRLKSTKSS